MQRKIKPVAESMFIWLQDTYQIGPKIDAWCRDIVSQADNPNKPITEVPIEEILDEIDAITGVPGVGSLAAGAMAKVLGFFRSQKPPARAACQSKVFDGLSDGTVKVGVRASYVIDPGEGKTGTVTFMLFDSYTPEIDSGEDAKGEGEESRTW